MGEVKRELESATTATLAVAPVMPGEDRAEELEDTRAAVGDAESADRTEGPGSSAAPLPSPTPASAEQDAGHDAGRNAGPRPPRPPRQPSRMRARLRARLPIIAVLAVVALLTAGIVAAITASNSPGGTNTASPPSPTRARTSSPGTPSHPATPPPSSSGVTGGGGTGASASPTPSTTASVSVASQLSARITQYYQLVPGHLDEAWGYMTADYQQNHAGGMKNYQAFWEKVRRVSISDLVVESPSTVLVTIEYDYTNGQDERDRTSITLVKQKGSWEIASSSVLGTG